MFFFVHPIISEADELVKKLRVYTRLNFLVCLTLIKLIPDRIRLTKNLK